MKRKVITCVMGLVLAMSLAACGEEEVVVENTNGKRQILRLPLNLTPLL